LGYSAGAPAVLLLLMMMLMRYLIGHAAASNTSLPASQ
jgi:hypothetical protein